MVILTIPEISTRDIVTSKWNTPWQLGPAWNIVCSKQHWLQLELTKTLIHSQVPLKMGSLTKMKISRQINWKKKVETQKCEL